MKYITLLIICACFSLGGCIAQKDSTYQPFTEHQYEIEIEDDSILVQIFNELLNEEIKNRNYNGRISVRLFSDTDGNIINAELYDKIDFVIENEKLLIKEIQNRVKINVSENAQNFYTLTKRKIIVTYTLLGKNLK